MTVTPCALAIFQQQGALRIEDHCDTLGDSQQASFGPVVVGQLLVAVRPDFVLVALVGDPCGVGRRIIEARADDGDAKGGELIEAVAEPATLPCSDGCPCIGEEPQDGGVAEEIGRAAWTSV